MRRPIEQGEYADADLRRHGCTIASIAYIAREATDGEAGENRNAFAQRIRTLSGVPLETFRERGTTLDEAERAYEGLRFRGRVRPKMRRLRGVPVRAGLLPLLSPTSWALVAVNYGVVQDAGKGVGSFRGGHAVVVGEATDGEVPVADPLRSTVVRWPVPLLVRAMERFGDNRGSGGEDRSWGNGRGEAGVVERAMTILELRTLQRDKARAALEIAEERLLSARGVLELTLRERDEARGERDAAQEALAACEARPVDCSAVEGERDAARRDAEEARRVLADQVAGLRAALAEAGAILDGVTVP